MKKIASILTIVFLFFTMNISVYASEYTHTKYCEVLMSSSESIVHTTTKTPCSGSHSVGNWTLEGSYNEAPPSFGKCMIFVKDYRGLCNKCNYYVGRTIRKQLEHNFPASGMCENDCGVGVAR